MILATRTRRARRAGRCNLCQTAIQRGQPIALLGASWTHARCAASRIRDGTTTPTPPLTPPDRKDDHMTTTTLTPAEREQLAHDTAEHILSTLTRKAAQYDEYPGITVHYVDDERPPATTAGIKAALLDGRVWIGWTDDTVTAAMRTLHGEPTGDAALFAGGEE